MGCKNEDFDTNNCKKFIFAKNREGVGGSYEYPQSMFKSRNEKNNVHSYKPQFYYINWG